VPGEGALVDPRQKPSRRDRRASGLKREVGLDAEIGCTQEPTAVTLYLCERITHGAPVVQKNQGRSVHDLECLIWIFEWGLPMFRRFLLTIALLAFASALFPASSSAAPPSSPFVAVAALHYFATEDTAQQHCPRDVVVWLNIPSGIYHYKGERWYGRTKHGAYVCEREAIAAGDRASENGQ
jgi:hypothetical protein